MIALNELFGEGARTPWSPTNATYRANVLALMQRLAAKGARPVLFVHGDPNTDGAAADWWRQVAETGPIVYEPYFNGAHLSRARTGDRSTPRPLWRAVVRRAVRGIGIKADRLGIALGFHSSRTPGVGGRQGLEPAASWFRVVKWEAIATRAGGDGDRSRLDLVLGLGAVRRRRPRQGRDRLRLSVVARRVALRRARQRRAAFNTSLVEGQIVLPPGVDLHASRAGTSTRPPRRRACRRHAQPPLRPLGGLRPGRTPFRRPGHARPGARGRAATPSTARSAAAGAPTSRR